ncbi:MAG: sugar phosphate isomerase/epimerase family protein [Candidatus Acidiferrum sp.]
MKKRTRREFVKAGVAGALGLGIGGGAAARELIGGGAELAKNEAGKNHEAAASGRMSAEAAAANSATGRETSGRAAGPLPITKGLVYDMLPAGLSVAERFKLARDTGFDVVQANTTPDLREAEEIKKAAEAAGIRIDSVMNMDHWKYPLSSSDSAVVAKSMAGMRTSLHNAKLWGSDAVLLVPAVVNPQTTYLEAWTRSQKQIRELIPLAAELKVVIAIEEVWNKFLLSPLEMKKYIAEFESPWIKSWFDVGNVVLYGYPQDWIHTLGKSIAHVHLKDFKRKENGYAWVNLGDGDVDWPAVRQAFADIGYRGSAIAELDGGDEAYLRDVSKRIDRLVVVGA